MQSNDAYGLNSIFCSPLTFIWSLQNPETGNTTWIRTKDKNQGLWWRKKAVRFSLEQVKAPWCSVWQQESAWAYNKGDGGWRKSYWLCCFTWTVSSICLWPYSRCAVWAEAIRMYYEDGLIERNAHLTAVPAIEILALQGENKAYPRKSTIVARCSNQLQSTTQMALWNRKDTLTCCHTFASGSRRSSNLRANWAGWDAMESTTVHALEIA